jgi:hypothetical protein
MDNTSVSYNGVKVTCFDNVCDCVPADVSLASLS